ncbi:MAG: hypothetical protein GDA40_01080 [Rhodobacteraceae bacterium]|nr:hypothetical protein [Paracoccaceae bacterium]
MQLLQIVVRVVVAKSALGVSKQVLPIHKRHCVRVYGQHILLAPAKTPAGIA